jgi:hypothetical protein
VTSGACSALQRESASATMLSHPGRYLTVKSNLNSLLIHWCYGTVDKRWSSRYFRLKWSVRTRN